jgi:hypothetical protein
MSRNSIGSGGLLRVHRQRPRNTAAQQREELAPFHGPMPPVLLAEMIGHLSCVRRLLHCGISSDLCRRWVDAVEKVSANLLWN